MDSIKNIRCTIMRGGTSKGIFIMENDLPKDKAERDKIICQLFGSPDVRQINGLGGADPLTSKLAIIGPPSRPDADIDYTFGQVSINALHVDYRGNCGNISSAVGPFAIDNGLVKSKETMTTVRIHNTNTHKMIVADIPMANGKAAVIGDCVCPGVPGTGAKIMLDYSDTAGAFSGKILPTGNPVDILEVPGIGPLTMSLVDVANPMVFIRAKDINLTGIETPQEVGNNAELSNMLEKIRGVAAVKFGLAEKLEDVLTQSPARPIISFVNTPSDYKEFNTGNLVKADDVDLVSRIMFMQVMHKTYSGTAAICTAVAATIPGTVVHGVVENARGKSEIRIGHPSGVIDVEVASEIESGQVILKRAAISRTARRLMDGYAYLL